MSDSEAPTERSPLLPRVKGPQSHAYPTDPGAGLIPQGADPHGDAVIHDEPVGTDDVEQQNGSTPEEQGSVDEARKRRTYIFAAVAIGVFLAAADQTIIVSSYGKIGSDLDALNKTSWIANAYFLTLTAFQPLYGKLSDIFGRKECLLFAYLIFGLGCLFCGLSKSIDHLIMSRAFAGIGGGGMTTIVSILFSDIIPLRDRGTWQGYINIIYATGAGLGAPMGGIIADYISWRWAFLAQTPLCFIAFVAVWYLLHLPKRDESHWKAKLGRIDFLGAIILLAAVATLLVGMDRGSNVAWSDKITIACLAAAILLFAIFVAVEFWVAAEPFAPGHVIFERSVFAAYLCNFFSFCGWLAAIFYIPLYFQAVHGLSAAQASLLIIPSVICGVCGSLFGGKYMQRTGHYYWLTFYAYCFLVVGMLVILACSGLLVSSLAGIVVGMMICAFSNGCGVTTSLIALLANVTDEDQAIATACSYLFRSMGSVSGVAISATAVNQMLRNSLHERLGSGADADKIANEVRRNLDSLKTLPEAVRDVVRDCYASSTRVAFGLDVILVFGAALSALWIRETVLNRSR